MMTRMRIIILPKLADFRFKVQRLQLIENANSIDLDPEYPT